MALCISPRNGACTNLDVPIPGLFVSPSSALETPSAHGMNFPKVLCHIEALSEIMRSKHSLKHLNSGQTLNYATEIQQMKVFYIKHRHARTNPVYRQS